MKELERLTVVQEKTKIQKLSSNLLLKKEHKIRRSREMKDILDNYAIPDNEEWDRKILNSIVDVAENELKNKTGTVGSKESVKVFFDTPKGKIIFDTKWEKIDSKNYWMNTVIVKTLK